MSVNPSNHVREWLIDVVVMVWAGWGAWRGGGRILDAGSISGDQYDWSETQCGDHPATARATLSEGWTPHAVINQGLQRDVRSANWQDGWANYFSSTHSCTAAQLLGSPGEGAQEQICVGRGNLYVVRRDWSEYWLRPLVLAHASGFPLA